MQYIINTGKFSRVTFEILETSAVVRTTPEAGETSTVTMTVEAARNLYRATLAAAPAELQDYAAAFAVGDKVKVQTMKGVQFAVVTHADRAANSRGYTLRFICGSSVGSCGDGWHDRQLKRLTAADQQYVRRQNRLEYA